MSGALQPDKLHIRSGVYSGITLVGVCSVTNLRLVLVHFSGGLIAWATCMHEHYTHAYNLHWSAVDWPCLPLPPAICPSCLQYWSKGISACAICDGASGLFKEREVAVVGGGDSAAEEAVYLTKYASRVHLLVRGPQMRASKAMADRASSHPKVQVHYNTGIEDGYGDGVLEVRGRLQRV